MKVYLPKGFAREARKLNVSDHDCCEAVKCAEKNLIDANLGGGLIKQRIARPSQGKFGGHRAIIYYRRGEIAIPVHILAKNEKANISDADQNMLADLAQALNAIPDLDTYARKQGWKELDYDQPREKVSKRSVSVRASSRKRPAQSRSTGQGDDASLRPALPDPGEEAGPGRDQEHS
jgi:hypothetical protein